ncbi:MAG: zinc dependent phospholipase C family protein [Oscillospiraceae bacterium]|nr:zinc dependent phospholipase C family protein [Oscillospiraceae bacterium]
MPETYAHYCMGRDVLDSLPDELYDRISNYRSLFDIGLHGPDIFFYYIPVIPNHVNITGYAMHKRNPRAFLKNARRVIRNEETAEDQNAELAYIFGFLCHYVLDRYFHAYIISAINKYKVNHSQLETAFDCRLIKKDGYDPKRYKITSHIHPSAYNSTIISKFYAGITPKEVRSAMYQQIFLCNTLVSPSPYRKMMMNVAFLFTGTFKFMHNLLIMDSYSDKVEKCCDDMSALYDLAVKDAVSAIGSFMRYMNGKSVLKGFGYSFKGLRDE